MKTGPGLHLRIIRIHNFCFITHLRILKIAADLQSWTGASEIRTPLDSINIVIVYRAWLVLG